MLLYILEITLHLTIIGSICYLTEKFIIKKESECND